MHSLSDKLLHPLDTLRRKILNRLTPKDPHSVFLIPHFNGIADGYDIINYRSDNVLCLFNGLLHDARYDDWTLNILYYDASRLDDYRAHCLGHHPGRVNFVPSTDRRAYDRAFFHSAHVFTDHNYHWLRFRAKGQQIVCLNYFPGPFKDDYISLPPAGKAREKERRAINGSYDFQLSVSDLFSALLSKDCLLAYEKFVPLGYPRNDVFYADNTSLKEAVLAATGIRASRIVCYTPTHRDYESSDRKMYDAASAAVSRSVFGGDASELERMDQALEKADAILVAKVHPSQETSVLSAARCRRVVLYSQLRQQLTLSLNEILAVSDLLVTDYTSAVYDFLHADKPVVYYFYDYEKYLSTRGLFINPIEPFCAGYMAYDFEALLQGIEACFREDFAADRRRWLRDLVLRHRDGQSLQRVMDYFLPVE